MYFSNKALKRICVLYDFQENISESMKVMSVTLAKAMVKAQIGLVCRDMHTDVVSLIAKTIHGLHGHVAVVANSSILDLQRLDFINEIHFTSSHHESRMTMFNLSDGFIVLPGGSNTLETLMEYLTWMQRVYQSKPVYIVNLNGFWNPLLKMFDYMRQEGFLADDFEKRYKLVTNVEDIFPDFVK